MAVRNGEIDFWAGYFDISIAILGRGKTVKLAMRSTRGFGEARRHVRWRQHERQILEANESTDINFIPFYGCAAHGTIRYGSRLGQLETI